MLDIAFWIAVGLVVGWNILPQPEWVRSTMCWFADKVRNLF